MGGSFETPRSAPRLIGDAFGLYRRYPLLFFVLAAGVIVPYELIVLATTGTGPLSGGSLGAWVSLLLTLLDLALVTPLVSALHVHAVVKVREGEQPRLLPVARRGLAVLPVVAAASIMATLGIFVGFLALIVPGIILALRWSVVAQAAAIEHEGWLPALRRSGRLVSGNYWHVFVLLLLANVIGAGVAFLLGLGFDDNSTGVASFVVGLVAEIFSLSFIALATALLYLDLRARHALTLARERAPAGGPTP